MNKKSTRDLLAEVLPYEFERNKNALGDRVAWLSLTHDRSLQITAEIKGLSEENYFYSFNLLCSVDEFLSDAYKETKGSIDYDAIPYCSIDELAEKVLYFISLHNEEWVGPSKEYLDYSASKTAADIGKRAQKILNDALSEPNGHEAFMLANILYMLKESTEHLPEQDVLRLAQKTLEASECSTAPLLTAERVDAVSTLIEYGVSPIRTTALPEASAEQMTEILLNCDLDIFTDIIETIAIANQEFYEPDREYSFAAQQLHAKAILAILEVTEEKPSTEEKLSLDEIISSAEARTSTSVKAGHEPEKDR